MRIALTGGTGFVGEALIVRALAERHEIAALARRPQPRRVGVDWHAGDLSDSGALSRLVADCEAVVHVAGVVNAPDPAAFEECNVTGTLNLIEACAAAGVPRFVYVSSLAAREPELSVYGATKARAERLVMASALDWTIVRPPAIYGPRDRELLELFKAAKWGVIPTPKDGRLSVVHVGDLARLLLEVLPGGEQVTGEIFEPDDGRYGGWSHFELARTIGQAVGGRPRVIGLSRWWLTLGARLDQLLRRGKAKLTLDRAAYFSHSDWVVGESAKPPPWLWEPQIETRAGLKATANWYREHRWL